MKLAIIGSRSFNDPALLAETVATIPDVTHIVSGGARGADTIAAAYATQFGIPMTIIRPQYKIYNKNAPLIRNKEIVNTSDMLLAFWDGESKGSAYTINYAKSIGLPTIIIYFRGCHSL